MDKEKLKKDVIKVLETIKIEKMVLGKKYTYKCPLCEGNLMAKRNSYNGHLTVYCSDCKFNLVQ